MTDFDKQLDEIIKHLVENLEIEVESVYTGEYDNQDVHVRLKINGTTFSKSDCEIKVNDS